MPGLGLKCSGEPLLKYLVWASLFFTCLSCFSAQSDHECPQDQYLNASLGLCQTCTNCSSMGLNHLTPCSKERDTVCEPPQLALDCTQCPQGLCEDQYHCLCEPAGCYKDGDIYCQHSTCTEMLEDSTTSGSTSEDQNSSLQSWSIGLMAAAMLLGTIAVPACILLMCFYTPSRIQSTTLEPIHTAGQNPWSV